MLNDLLVNDNASIENMIYEIRGLKVMLASDIAKLYNSETKIINQVVKRNIERFPTEFCFQLTKDEYIYLRSQFVTSKVKGSELRNEMAHGGNRYLPYVFTEHGVIMLSGLLKSDVAAKINIRVINAFVSMRHVIARSGDVYKSINNINTKLIEHDEKLESLLSKFDKKEELFLPGEEFSAYKRVMNIFNGAREELIIIDSYADIDLLDSVRNVECQILLITSKKAKLSKVEIEKFNRQYNNRLKVIINETFHDRYFILDKKIVYHCGTSINRIGTKIFSINQLEDEFVKSNLIKYIFTILK